MTTLSYTIIIAITGAVIAAVIFPVLIKLSLKLGYTDKPDNRKLHKQPVPVIGGIGIVITLVASSLFIPQLRAFVSNHTELAVASLIVAVTGIVDDKYRIPAKLKLLIEVLCAAWVVHTDIRLDSLLGFLGIDTVPVAVQYVLSILIVAGITNAFNLLDGIDGLAGTVALVNLSVMAVIAYLQGQYDWAMLMVLIAGSVVIFLRYNRTPARLFMGDGGSLFLGFLMSITAIHLLRTPTPADSFPLSYNAVIVTIAGCFIIPVVDTLRVFIQRIDGGKPAFKPDRTHLHHKLLQHFMPHNKATTQLVSLHLLIIFCPLFLYQWLSISVIITLQVLAVMLYTFMLDFAHNFSRWYRFVKRLENKY